MSLTVSTKLVGIPIFDVESNFSSKDQLFAVAERIKSSHGGTTQHLRLWKSKVEPGTILRDMYAKLGDIFNIPDGTESDPVRVCIYYDFGPFGEECPILNV